MWKSTLGIADFEACEERRNSNQNSQTELLLGILLALSWMDIFKIDWSKMNGKSFLDDGVFVVLCTGMRLYKQ